MTEPEKRHVPPPVAAAATIFPLVMLGQIIQILTSGADEASGLAAGLFSFGLAVLGMAMPYGLFRALGRARNIMVAFSAFNIFYAVVGSGQSSVLQLIQMVGAAAVICLLLVPASSRGWFLAGT